MSALSTEASSRLRPADPRADGADADRGAIQSIERAAAVLGLLDHRTRALTPALVAERLGLNRTTAHRYLQSLQASGFLDAGYGLGPLFDQLAAHVTGRQQVLALAPAVLRQLSDETGLTAVLSVPGRSGAVVALVEEPTKGTILLTVKVGTMLEARAAQTRVLLAFQSDPGTIRRFHAGLGAADAERELTMLSTVRRERLAWAELGRVGLASVAAPVFGRRDVQAAMALLGTTATLAPAGDSARRVALLRAAADRLSGQAAS